jgi:hypothetical protein
VALESRARNRPPSNPTRRIIRRDHESRRENGISSRPVRALESTILIRALIIGPLRNLFPFHGQLNSPSLIYAYRRYAGASSPTRHNDRLVRSARTEITRRTRAPSNKYRSIRAMHKAMHRVAAAAGGGRGDAMRCDARRRDALCTRGTAERRNGGTARGYTDIRPVLPRARTPATRRREISRGAFLSRAAVSLFNLAAAR